MALPSENLCKANSQKIRTLVEDLATARGIQCKEDQPLAVFRIDENPVDNEAEFPTPFRCRRRGGISRPGRARAAQ